MTYTSIYISAADEINKIGTRIGPTFPSGGNKDGQVEAWASKHKKFKIVRDWGSYFYIVNKSELVELIRLLYGNDPNFNNAENMLEWEGKNYMVDRLDDLVKFAAELEDNKPYALVWSEL